MVLPLLRRAVQGGGVAEVVERARPQDVECPQSLVDAAGSVLTAQSVEDLAEDPVGQPDPGVGEFPHRRPPSKRRDWRRRREPFAGRRRERTDRRYQRVRLRAPAGAPRPRARARRARKAGRLGAFLRRTSLDELPTIAADLGVPVVTLPYAYYPDGTPFAVAWIGESWTEAELLGFASALEAVTQARRAPTLSSVPAN